eukprot:CAMPEP_0202894786 /NCGR_PEP_ID=MMETSP1392-20130828/4108_1 /ASSEMBLY_ACC=CAM_ASM_000868 /TAXON_ID=225041 /ORGANISM="Chlamydomonas chlamydogama, Strain SAG 11-48b" /LENGTH=192 /DNA_ID=CAMNT_0049579577 /DNA_START=57 /DNA_END=635 /DNA_ORIENTATION=-
MAALSQSRALAGVRAFTTVRPRQIAQVSNGTKVTMRRKDTYMVEVQVGEEEPEDIAVRRFMKAVVQTKVIEKLRSRKTKETKIEAYKRRLRERHEARKLGLVEPTWEEAYGEDVDPKPFDEFFARDPDNELYGDFPLPNDEFFPGNYADAGFGDNKWGGYMDQGRTGGYMNQQGGYMNQQGGYINQNGGYMQ